MNRHGETNGTEWPCSLFFPSFLRFLILFSTLLLTDCGLPQYAYLEAPSVSANTDESSLDAEFWNTTQNNPAIFQGFQLYYRFFEDDETLKTGIGKIKNSRDLTSGDNDYRPLERGLNGKEEIGGQEYAAGEADSRSPLVRLTEDQKNESLKFTIDFGSDQVEPDKPQIFDSTLTDSDSSVPPIALCRNPPQNRINDSVTTRKPRSFKKGDFYNEDGDIPTDYKSDDNIYLSVFVMAFGRQNDGTSLYSLPKSLGSFKLVVDPLKGSE